jgi:hypothetical protein
MRRTICILGLGLLLVAAGLALEDWPAREPFDKRAWSVDSVMILNDATTTTYAMRPPFCVVRGGRITLARHEEPTTPPTVRVDMTIDGEHVIVFARLRDGSGHGPSN